MAEALTDSKQEFWKPAKRVPLQLLQPNDRCRECGTEYATGAVFCHSCGVSREPDHKSSPAQSHAAVPDDLVRGWRSYGMMTACSFVMGIGCLFAAASVGLLNTPESVFEWQAIQLERIEWLLAGAVVLLAGILLKRKSKK